MTRFRALLSRLKRRARSSQPPRLIIIPGFLRCHWIAGSLVVVVLLSGLGYLVAVRPWQTCGRHDRDRWAVQRVRRGDRWAASFPPDLGLQTVLGKIKAENDDVLGRDVPFVSIGYVVPLPRDATTGLLTALRHELQGAYLAQWRANHDDGLRDVPLIRLLVVNVGDQAEHQDMVIPELIRRVADPTDHLVAVAGLGPGFLAALAGRSCPQLKIDLFTGDDGVDLTAALRQQLADGNQDGIAANLRTNITFRYTGLTHPGGWSDQQRFLPASTRILQFDCTTCFTQVFPGEALDDGAAIVGYDALLVAIRAICSGFGQRGNTSAGPAALTPARCSSSCSGSTRLPPYLMR